MLAPPLMVITPPRGRAPQFDKRCPTYMMEFHRAFLVDGVFFLRIRAYASAYAAQRPMITYTGMGTVGPSPHGLLATEFEFYVHKLKFVHAAIF
ncbi:hypothetical protein TNCV_3621531 [Trichonephila clavipes]|nr:hypothetical protein TNCV_3621531 [Trichonephila clavipes]